MKKKETNKLTKEVQQVVYTTQHSFRLQANGTVVGKSNRGRASAQELRLPVRAKIG